MSEIDQHPSTTAAVPTETVAQLEKLGIAAGSYSFRPLDGLRKLIARRMSESVRTAPHFSVSMRMEVDALMARRADLNANASVKVSVNDLLIKASGLALMECPQVNSGYTDAGIITHAHADISFAVSFAGGLVTPIIRHAESKSVRAIADETRDLADRGRRKRLRPEEYNGGSFTVTNLGMFGVSAFDAIINQPQGAILSIGAPERCYQLDGETPRVALVLTATLTSDHRVIDGASSAAWLNKFKHHVEDPLAWTASD